MKKGTLIACLSLMIVAAFAVSSIEAVAQLPIDKEIELTKQVVQAKRQLIIGNVMDFTEEEAAAFWPLYTEYRGKTSEVVDRKIALIQDFAENFSALTDEKSAELLEKALDVEEETLDLKEEYVEKIGKVLPATKTLRYFQTENKLNAIINFDIATTIPLAGDWSEGIEE